VTRNAILGPVFKAER